MIKVIIFDLDGTAIPNEPNGRPSIRLIKAIESARGKIKLCAATGRPRSNAGYILDALHLTDPCIVAAGTQIINPETKEVLWEQGIEAKAAQRVLDACMPFPYEFKMNEELMGSGLSAAQRTIEGKVNVMYLMQVKPAEAPMILRVLNTIEGITATSMTSWTQGGIDIHITSSIATKEHSVQVLLKMLGLVQDQSVGVGDGDNDIHLFKSVGLSIAMGNATDNLKSQADIVAASVEEDGLAQIIEQYARL